MKTAKPQGATPDLGEKVIPHYFSCGQYNALLAQLHEAIADKNHRIRLIEGVKGIGKSTFIYQFQDSTPNTWKFCRIDANPALYQDQLLARIAQGFSVIEEDDWLSQHVIDRLNDLYLTGFMPIVIIDDAHFLPESTISSLIQLFHSHPNGNFPLQILLFAEMSIEKSLALLDKSDLTYIEKYDFPRLTIKQTKDYVQHLLPSNTSLLRKGLTDSKLDEIFLESRGLPSLIEKQVKYFLRDKKSHFVVITEQFKRYKHVIALFLMIIFISILIFYDDHDASMIDVEIRLLSEESSNNQKERDGDEIMVNVEAVSVESVSEIMVADTVEPVMEPIGVVTVESRPKIKSPDGVKSKVVALVPLKSSSQRSKPQLVEDISSNKKQVKIIKTENKEVHAIKWIRRQNANFYTLQLLASRDTVTMRKFIKSAKLKGNVAYFRSMQKGKPPWYVVIYGVYQSQSEARVAKARLPKHIRRGGLWIRTFASIQHEIRYQ